MRRVRAGRSVSGRRTKQALTRFADADVSRFHAEQMAAEVEREFRNRRNAAEEQAAARA